MNGSKGGDEQPEPSVALHAGLLYDQASTLAQLRTRFLFSCGYFRVRPGTHWVRGRAIPAGGWVS